MMSNLAQAFLLRKRPTSAIIQRGLYSAIYAKSVTTTQNETHGDRLANYIEQPSQRNLDTSHINRELCSRDYTYVNSGTKSNNKDTTNLGILGSRFPNQTSLELRRNLINEATNSHSSMVNQARVLMWSSSVESIGDQYQQRGRHKQRDDNNSSRSQFKGRLFWSLGLLGVFKRITADDIEEEKNKLTDEEKVKKMTPAELLIAKGVLKLCDLEYDKAEALFHEALHLAQKDENEEQETLVLNLLATNYFDSGKFEEAEKLYVDLIKRLIASEMAPSDPAILELSLKLSSIYSKNVKHHNKAFKGFEFVINSLLYSLQDLLKDLENVDVLELSEQQRNDLALLGWAYDWFARHLIAMNDYIGAVDMLKRALDISSKILGPLHDQTLILLNDVGTTLAMINSAEEGRIYIKRAVEGALESQSRELASFYVNLGLVNLQLKKLDEARRYCEYSIELASKNADHHNKGEILKLSHNCLDEVKRLLQVQSHQ